MQPYIPQLDTQFATLEQKILSKTSRRLLQVSLLFLCVGVSTSVIHAADNAEINENLYQTKYVEQNKSQLKSLASQPETKLELGREKAEDNTAMLENGYDLMGSSDFVSGSISMDLAREFGQLIKADKVLIYESNVPVNTKLVSLDGSADGEKMANEANNANAQHVQTIHSATYWAKLPSPLFGVHVIKLVPAADKEGARIAPEVKGLTVIAVIKGSAASKAGVLKGDNLLKVGEMELDKSEDLLLAVKRYKGKLVPVELQRDENPLVISVDLRG
jgi:cell division protein FtsB